MACKVMIQTLAALACLAAAALCCTKVIYKDELPSDAEAFLQDPALWPMRVVLANEQNTETAAKISCYSVDSDFTVTAYNSVTANKTYTEYPTSKAASNQSFVVTYKPSNNNFLGVSAGNTSLTLTLQAVTTEFTIWEGCSIDGNTGSNWIMMKNTASRDDFDVHCVQKSLETSYNIDSTLFKGLCP